jgi:replication factor A1
MVTQLTAGCCTRLHHATPEDDALFEQEHIVQFLSIKKVNSNNAAGVDRYRIIISDGINFIQAMLATQLNSMVNDNIIGKHTIAVIDKLTCNYVQEKRYVTRRVFPDCLTFCCSTGSSSSSPFVFWKLLLRK